MATSSGVCKSRASHVLLAAVALILLGCGAQSFGTLNRGPLPSADAGGGREPVSPPRSAEQGGAGQAFQAPCPASLPDLRLAPRPDAWPPLAEPASVLTSGQVFEPAAACTWTLTLTHEPVKDLAVWFVLDVSGSMRPHIDQVRSGMEQLFAHFSAKGWSLRVGAVAFTDAVLDVVAETHDLSAFLQRTATGLEEGSAWDTPVGKGGDQPEAGFSAIACALIQMRDPGRGLEDSFGCGEEPLQSVLDGGRLPLLAGAAEKQFPEEDLSSVRRSTWLVYVSDAPARNTRAEFSAGRLAEALGESADELRKKGAQLRFYGAAQAVRRGLLPHWPTPLDQLVELTGRAGVPFQAMTFPVTSENIDQTFVADAREEPSAVSEQMCTVEELGQIRADGLRFNAVDARSRAAFRVSPTPGDEPSAVYVQRLCAPGGFRVFETWPIASVEPELE